MMKWILSIAMISLASLPLAAAADGAHGHADGKEAGSAHMHEDAGFGKPGEAKRAGRTIRVEMRDTMRFSPEKITLKRGETVRFVVENKGQVQHEMVLGTVKELAEHAEMMRKFPGMEHDDQNQVKVDPGKTAEMVWQFTQAGEFHFACLAPGHFEAGMVGRITVAR
jgi:uncharacterized cupredoxin-like copper-binding protein